MDEQTAKTKWCPFARALDEGEARAAINRGGQGEERGRPDVDCLCLASGCMAWRPISPLVPDDGYCGLAGPLPYPVRQATDDD